MKSKHLSMEAVSSILYKVDIMNTCCLENSLTDEYDSEAKAIVVWLDSGRDDVDQCVTEIFEQWFWDGCLKTRATKLHCIVKELELLLSTSR